MRTPVGIAPIPLRHFAVEFAVSAVSFWLVAAVLPDITIDEPLDALLAAGLERHPEDRALNDLMVRALSIR